MVNALDRAYIWAYIKMSQVKDDVKEFLSNQSGVSNVVATIIVLLITVLLIAAFWGRLKTWINDIMGQIFGNSFDGTGLGGD